jgi:hypothetical protein
MSGQAVADACLTPSSRPFVSVFLDLQLGKRMSNTSRIQEPSHQGSKIGTVFQLNQSSQYLDRLQPVRELNRRRTDWLEFEKITPQRLWRE